MLTAWQSGMRERENREGERERGGEEGLVS
jgi:hypothetical protein